MWSNKERNDWEALEAAAEKAGGYLAAPKGTNIMEYDYRAMSRYASAKGITSMELTDSERDMFKFDRALA